MRSSLPKPASRERIWSSSRSRRATTDSLEVSVSRSEAISTSPIRVVSLVSRSKRTRSATTERPRSPAGAATTPESDTPPRSMSNCIEAAMPTKSSLWNCTGSRDQSRSGARRKCRCGPDSSSPSTRNRAFPRNSSASVRVSMSISSAATTASPSAYTSRSRTSTPRKRCWPSLGPSACSASPRRTGRPWASNLVNSIASETTSSVSSGTSSTDSNHSAARRSKPACRRSTRKTAKTPKARMLNASPMPRGRPRAPRRREPFMLPAG